MLRKIGHYTSEKLGVMLSKYSSSNKLLMTSCVQPITLPDKPLFLLTVDTEEEWDWAGAFPRPPFSTKNIEQIAPFQAFCKELNIKPTYFVDYAVADHPEHAAMLNSYLLNGECDIGAHLHPWTTPPVDEVVNDVNSHAVNLPLSLFTKKMQSLTSKLEQVFGTHPYSYRAGRWGVNAQHLKVLTDLGYRVDSSVRPFYKDQAFSYESAPTRPYWPSSIDALALADECGGILEIPATNGYNFSNFELLDQIRTKLSIAPMNRLHLIGMLWRIGLMRQISVTPEGTNASDVCRCIDACIKRGDQIITMFFHSSDLLPGSTPYVRTEADKVRFMQLIQQCVEHVRRKHSASMTTMRDIREQLTGTP